MKKHLLICVSTMLLVTSLATSQEFRIRSLGGMTLAMRDPDFSLSLYDFAGNPAWLLKDETRSWLRIIPSASEQSGTLHRLYDPARTVMYGAGFDGVKALDEKGTFRGYTFYGVEKRRDVYRSLKRFPYDGEAFFVTDTTTGNFTYNGPTVEFMYSYEIFSGLLFGASVHYQLLDGLKDIYTSTKSLYRELRASIGVAYQLSDNFAFGVTFEPSDNQESMEAKSEELYEVELFNYRGETFASRQRSNTIEHKVRRKGDEFGAHLFWSPLELLHVGLRGDYGVRRTQILVPRGVEKEAEEGYASQDYYDARLQARYMPAENLTFGVSFNAYKNREWSRYSALDLTVWDWNTKSWSVGGGVGYGIPSARLLVGAEYEFSRTSVDSSKYIDNRFVLHSMTRQTLRSGVECEVLQEIYLRAGYVFRFDERDVLTGGKNVVSHGVTGGAGVRLGETAFLDLFVEYMNSKLRENNQMQRSHLAGGIMLRLLSL